MGELIDITVSNTEDVTRDFRKLTTGLSSATDNMQRFYTNIKDLERMGQNLNRVPELMGDVAKALAEATELGERASAIVMGVIESMNETQNEKLEL